MSRTLFHLWCIFVVCNCHTHIAYGARTEPRRSSNLSKDLHFQSSDAGYFNSEPSDKTSVEKWSSKTAGGERDDSVVRVSSRTKRDNGQEICGKKNSGGVEWSCKKISSCQFAEKLLSTKQRTVCAGEGSSQKICCPDRIDPVKVAQEKCKAYAPVKSESIQKREAIFNGRTDVEIREFAHMALIGFKNAGDPTNSNVEWNCGGSLISPEYVMTAAHCNDRAFSALAPTWVVLGQTTKPSNNESRFTKNHNVYRIAERINHPEYNSGKYDNDVALFKLNRSVEFNWEIRPVCLALPPNAKYKASEAIVTGWGSLESDGVQSEKLSEAPISLLNNSKCVRAYENETKLSKGFDAIRMICAGRVMKSDGGPCKGDSGGPLQFRIDSSKYRGMWYQEGITSIGRSYCEGVEPKIYTRVPHFLPWIQSKVWPLPWIQPILWPTKDLI